MSTPQITAPEPGRAARLGALGPLLFGAHAGWMLAVAATGVLIPALMEQVDPAAKVALFGVLTSIGAVAALIANIVFGALSDRARTRFGRRNPFILAGGVVAAACLAAMSLTSSFVVLVLLYVGFQIGLNALLGPLFAVLPDRVPPARRGTASTWIGAGTLLAQSLGAVVGAAFLSDVRTGLAVAPWIVVVTSVVFVLAARDRSIPPPAEPLSARALLRTFRIPTDRDFLLALFGRLLLLLAFYSALLYQLFVLQDYIGLDDAGVAGTIALGGLVTAISAGIGTVASGPLSDLVGRRKPLIVVASFVIAAAFVPLIVAPSRTTFLVFLGVAGVAYGVFIAVDQALMADVLPSDDDHGRDLGILNIANTAPNFIAPGVVGLALGTGLGYPGLFTITAVLAAVSGLVIGAIRRVR